MTAPADLLFKRSADLFFKRLCQALLGLCLLAALQGIVLADRQEAATLALDRGFRAGVEQEQQRCQDLRKEDALHAEAKCLRRLDDLGDKLPACQMPKLPGLEKDGPLDREPKARKI